MSATDNFIKTERRINLDGPSPSPNRLASLCTDTLQMKTTISVRQAELSDLENLMALNKKWQKHLLQDYSRGFLSSNFSVETFECAIANSDIVVCDTGQFLAGYYLTYNTASRDILKSYESILGDLFHKNIINSFHKIGLGAQAVVDRDFQGKGLRETMLTELLKLVNNKYDFLLSKIARLNTRAWNGHNKDGWKLVGEDHQFFYVILQIGR